MKTFTVTKLNRKPKAACDRITSLPDFRARLKRIFPRPIPKKLVAEVDRLIAGE
jgi:hypothetical protein